VQKINIYRDDRRRPLEPQQPRVTQSDF
jgi:hypothetical protein